MFSSSARNVSKIQSGAGGSTNLTAALRLAKGHRDISQVIVISDGYPDSPRFALKEASSIPVPISCIYVGPGEDEGYKFLKQLASAIG